MLKFYSTETKQLYDTEKEATAAERKLKQEAIWKHCNAYTGVREKYLRDLAKAQADYTRRKSAIIDTLKAYHAAPEMIQCILKDDIQVTVKILSISD